jgi:mxaJ protein
MRTFLIAAALLAGVASAAADERALRVCADPNNLPFSNEAQQGFENRVVAIVADELGARPLYTWWAQRRGAIRETLKTGLCDVIPGVASGLETIATTRPYYRSTYVFVTRADRDLELAGLADERLRTLRIGVQMIGDDFSNTPPAHALARRGIVNNVRGYMVYGDYAQDSPSRLIVEDVARGSLDVAAVWGPLAGYSARTQSTRLRLQPIASDPASPALPMTFSISMGVRREDRGLLADLNAALERRRAEIDAVLAEYGVPRGSAEGVVAETP